MKFVGQDFERIVLRLSLAGPALLCAVTMAGCGGNNQKAASTTTPARSAANDQSQYRNELLRSAINLVNTPEQFEDDRQATGQIVEQLNQWRRLTEEAQGKSTSVLPKIGDSDQKKSSSDHPAERDDKKINELKNNESKADEQKNDNADAKTDHDPLLETLPHDKGNDLLNSRWVRKLNDSAFDPVYDGAFLQEAALLRDVAASIEPPNMDDVSVAQALFDWTIRNIQCEPPSGANPTPEEQWLDRHLLGETLFYGRGTPIQRAWLFTLLARQAGLDVVLLATPDPRNPKQLRPWVTALVSDGELYLFDYTYGLPIPGPGGKGVATLSQAAADDAILRQMDTADRPYPRRAADLEKIVVLLEASPGYLEQRMKLLETQLTGRDRIVLSTSPAAVAEKLRAIKHVGEIKVWPLPYEVLEQRRTLTPEMQRAAAMERMPFSIPADPEEDAKHLQVDDAQRRRHPVYALRLARLLQLRGRFGKTDALRPSNQHGADLSAVAQRGATAYYLLALPGSDQLNELIRDQQDKIEIARGRFLSKEFVDAFQQKRDDAAFWLGVILFEQGDYQTAAQNFGPMTLDAYPTGPWTNAARFLLGRCYEAEGKTAEAIKLYEADKSPQRYGNRLRAERLKAQQGVSAEKKSAP